MSSWELPGRRTITDLHAEQDAVRGYFRVIAIAASWLILAGYIIFSLSFTSDSDTLNTNTTTLAAFGACFLIIGYVLTAIIYPIVKSSLFRFEAIFLPLLTSSAGGFFAVLLSLIVHQPLPISPIISLPITLSATSTLVSAISSFFAYRRIRTVRRRQERNASPVNDFQDQRRSWPSVPSIADDASTASLISHIPEDELQRQQLLRLLLKRDGDRAPSPEMGSSTYRIDLPSEPIPLETKFLPVPATAGRSGQSGVAGNGRSGWQLQNLRKFMPGTSRTAERENPAEDPRISRERRREEIERGDSPRLFAQVPDIQTFFPPPPRDREWRRASRYA